MHFSDEPIYIMDFFKLVIPVVTFAMGYYLTNIGYKRDRRLSIVREKFDRLYHPFYLLMHELGSNTADGEGLELGAEDISGFEPFFEHLTANMYLTSSEGQKLFWETRKLFISCLATGDNLDPEKEAAFGASFGALCEYLLQEYVETGKTLGYELVEDEEN